MSGESPKRLAFGFTDCRCQPLPSQWLQHRWREDFAKEGVWPYLDPWMLWVCAQHPASGMYWRSTCRMASSSSSSSRRSPSPLQRQWCLKPFVPAETLRALCFDWSAPDGSRRCLWVLLVLRCLFAGLNGPRYPLWKENVSCSGNESFGEVYEHNSECRAIEVIGQDWSSKMVALFPRGLGAWAGSFELLHGHGLAKK